MLDCTVLWSHKTPLSGLSRSPQNVSHSRRTAHSGTSARPPLPDEITPPTITLPVDSQTPSATSVAAHALNLEEHVPSMSLIYWTRITVYNHMLKSCRKTVGYTLVRSLDKLVSLPPMRVPRRLLFSLRLTLCYALRYNNRSRTRPAYKKSRWEYFSPHGYICR